MSLDDKDFEDDDTREQYRVGEGYIKMSKTGGWKTLRATIETMIESNITALETCDIKDFNCIRGAIKSMRTIISIVDGNIEEAISIEREIKKIPQEDTDA